MRSRMDRVKKKVNGIDKRLMAIKRSLGKLTKQLTVDNLDILEPKVDQIEILASQWYPQIEALIDDACQVLERRRSQIDHHSKQLIQECLQKKALVILQRLPLSNRSPDPSINTEWSPTPIDSSDLDFKTEAQEDSEIPIPMDVLAESSKIKVEELQPHEKRERPIRRRKRKRGTLRNIAKKRKKPSTTLPARTPTDHEFQCPFEDCSMTFPSHHEVKFEFHKLSHTVPNLMENFRKRFCPICGLVQHKNSGSGYCVHYLNHHNIRVLKYPCSYCPKKFWHSSMRANHEEKFHQNTSQTYSCDLCPYITNTLKKFKVHKYKKHAPHECKECNKPFTSAKSLAKHLKEHNTKAVCQFCGQSMFQRMLYMHIHAKHILRCGIEGCRSEFGSPEDLQAHRSVTHTADFICETCGGAFFTEVDLSRHTRTTHDSSRTCQWPGCGRIYPMGRTKRFYNHLKSHEIDAKAQDELKNYSGVTYPCEECGKIYTQQQSLTYHKISFHVEVEAFKCEVEGCGRAFKTKKSLIQHRGFHGKVASPCPHCPKICSSEQILKGHIVRVHKKERDLPFKCQVEGCGESYFRAKYLEIHMGKKHVLQ